MECIILAGGLGTRLREVVADVPKPLAPIEEIPFLAYLFAQLATFPEITRVILAVGYRAEALEAYVKDLKLPFALSLSREGRPLGTGGALLQAMALCKGSTFLVLNGDSFLDFALTPFLAHHRQLKGSMTLCSQEVEEVERFGALEFDARTFRLGLFGEKARRGRGWINLGIYLMERELLSVLAPLGPAFSLEQEGFPLLLEKGVFCYPCVGVFCDIGTKESYAEAPFRLKSAFSSPEARATLARFSPPSCSTQVMRSLS